MKSVFFCIDGHTAGNPVRLVAGGAPFLKGSNMSERRQDFLARFDWIRLGLMFEPRGHDMMSGGFVFPPIDPVNDAAILFIETSGCLPMCGHGTIGIVTFALEHGLIRPRTVGRLSIEVPAGVIGIDYTTRGDKVTSVTIRNVPSYVAAKGVRIDVPGLGPLAVDVAYGGNFYAIIEPQGAYTGIDQLGAANILSLSPVVRTLMREAVEPVHPLDSTIRGVSHVMWTDNPEGRGRRRTKCCVLRRPGNRPFSLRDWDVGALGAPGSPGTAESGRPVRSREHYWQPIHRSCPADSRPSRYDGYYSLD